MRYTVTHCTNQHSDREYLQEMIQRRCTGQNSCTLPSDDPEDVLLFAIGYKEGMMKSLDIPPLSDEEERMFIEFLHGIFHTLDDNEDDEEGEQGWDDAREATLSERASV